MNNKNIKIVVGLAIAIALFLVFFPKNKDNLKEETSLETLDRSTQDDTVTEIDSDLNNIDVNSSSSVEFENMDMEIKSL